MDFLHTYIPNSIAFIAGPFTIYWYGIIMALAIIVGVSLSVHIASRRGLSKEEIIDASIWLIIGGIIGARVYEIFLEWNYYSLHPSQIIKIWQGGLAIHGALIGGLIAAYLFTKNKTYNIWNLAAVMLPGFALAQAIGRFGNWFNQELFGLPTNLPWGIPIDVAHRPLAYLSETHFHPVFLYEAFFLADIALFLYLLARDPKRPCAHIVAFYLIFAGLLRFFLEFIKSDTTPILLGMRWPQIFSIVMIVAGIVILIKVASATKKARL